MNRCDFAGKLMEAAWVAIGYRCSFSGRDVEKVREAFDWNALVREALFSPESIIKFRSQKIWQLRLQALVADAEAKVPAPIEVVIPEAVQQGTVQ